VVEVEPGPEFEARVAEATSRLEGKLVRRAGMRHLWRVDRGRLRWLDWDRRPYTMDDYRASEEVDPYLLDRLEPGPTWEDEAGAPR
jgi:hypothetical protein